MTNDFEGNQSEAAMVEGVKQELNEIDISDLSEHAHRYEALHQKLQETLSEIDGL
ncbi:MAG: hypothetical protein ACR2I6_00825 [Candidatus Planktophila sp.]|jgi:predicted ATP-grasp superfamily ATP-dependent carboligase